ncbi:TetR/AcrR family transcriptional regulator [Paenibacillus agricola]|uniref:TetR/AcrR family transcriptional regulator n=1 Tax=Paenibacillus agricola TaxID=2716264 RepID=A0ABX0JAB1_9BACL|nr:TetR/AcrR family transcriptional regulator [Paenibacillus agricola]NHN32221.1 TetR/AcrR family transcriptional regulator [Paenibacillus agricola]
MNDTKQKLIHITRQMIDQQGIDGISMRELGKEMNLSRSAMYRHFKNKEDLLAAITAGNFETLTSNIREVTENISDSRKLLYAILYTYYDFGIKNQEHYHLMFRKQWDKELYPDIYYSAFGIFKFVEECLEKVGNIRKSPTQSTAIMYAFIHGLVELNSAQHSESEKGMDNPNRLIDSFLDLIFI